MDKLKIGQIEIAKMTKLKIGTKWTKLNIGTKETKLKIMTYLKIGTKLKIRS